MSKSEERRYKLVIEEECPTIPCRGWTEMIRRMYEVDLLLCPKSGAEMKVIAFLMYFSVVDRVANHLKLVFVAQKPLPPQIVYQELLMAAQAGGEHFL